MWRIVTGSEPVFCERFRELYLVLKRRGLLVSVPTNAKLVTEEHVALFKKYPPRDIGVTLYGVSRGTYEKEETRWRPWR